MTQERQTDMGMGPDWSILDVAPVPTGAVACGVCGRDATADDNGKVLPHAQPGCHGVGYRGTPSRGARVLTLPLYYSRCPQCPHVVEAKVPRLCRDLIDAHMDSQHE